MYIKQEVNSPPPTFLDNYFSSSVCVCACYKCCCFHYVCVEGAACQMRGGQADLLFCLLSGHSSSEHWPRSNLKPAASRRTRDSAQCCPHRDTAALNHPPPSTCCLLKPAQQSFLSCLWHVWMTEAVDCLIYLSLCFCFFYSCDQLLIEQLETEVYYPHCVQHVDALRFQP